MYITVHEHVPCVIARAVRAEERNHQSRYEYLHMYLVAYTKPPISPASVDENSPLQALPASLFLCHNTGASRLGINLESVQPC